jgi:hypothetical protein
MILRILHNPRTTARRMTSIESTNRTLRIDSLLRSALVRFSRRPRFFSTQLRAGGFAAWAMRLTALLAWLAASTSFAESPLPRSAVMDDVHCSFDRQRPAAWPGGVFLAAGIIGPVALTYFFL